MAHKIKRKSDDLYVPPLFDRLSKDAPRFYDEEQMKASIIREVDLILNTRQNLPMPESEEDEERPCPLFFGLEDFSSPNMDNMIVMKQKIKRLIDLYEPRLKNVRIVSIDYVPQRSVIRVGILAQIKDAQSAEDTDFPIEVRLAS